MKVFSIKKLLIPTLILVMLSSACQASSSVTTAKGPIKVLAVESFLADMAQNVAGDRLQVDTLIPVGTDPHSYQPTPQDVARIADSDVLIINGGGVEAWLQDTLKNAGGNHLLIETSKGLVSRKPKAGEDVLNPTDQGVVDPHFWLDPHMAVHYVENIRDGLTQVDPAGKDVYARNAQTYIAKLKDLDGWIAAQVAQIPPERRLLVTNHETFGYFADRYGFTIVGTIVPSVSTDSSPSARQLGDLINRIRATHAPAVFLEAGVNPQLAAQLTAETGITVVSDLYTHSITDKNGNAPSYIDMMRYDVLRIVNALK
jgi:ABC-type Zn uptake system ZnuABC Zn-binding protein ZnuA